MNEAEINDRMTGIFRDVFDEDDLVLTPHMTADDVADWDSLSHIRLILSLEKEFGVRFSTVELGSLKTVGDLTQLIGAKLGQ